jgi:hypothetical protein
LGVSHFCPRGVPPVHFSVLRRAEKALRLTGKMSMPRRKDSSYTLYEISRPAPLMVYRPPPTAKPRDKTDK